ncbi:MAG: protein phosphatase CheZ [Gammaproteobacteria bacterium]|nr:protein phosphatase CheZ [Gammaproteobacteria bacterium]
MTTAAEEIYKNQDERLELAKSLVMHLENGDEEHFKQAVNKLYTEEEDSLFQEIGKLTRQLHDALETFRHDERIGNLAEKDMPDARQRLKYVIEKTDKAAHRTLGAVEAALPLSENLKAEAGAMSGEWERFKRREMSAEDFRELSKRLEGFLSMVNSCSMDIHEHLEEILLSQDYQDITGQIIFRVINIVDEVEHELVSMIRNCGDSKTGNVQSGPDIKSEGPQINPDKRPDVVSSQDEVDDLLSSLGF